MYSFAYLFNYLANVTFCLLINLLNYMPTYPNNLSTLLLKLPFYLLTYLLT